MTMQGSLTANIRPILYSPTRVRYGTVHRYVLVDLWNELSYVDSDLRSVLCTGVRTYRVTKCNEIRRCWLNSCLDENTGIFWPHHVIP